MNNLHDGADGEFGRTDFPAHGTADFTRVEAEHRVANYLQLAASLLRYESRKITDAVSARAALENVHQRLHTLASLHRQVSRSVSDSTVELAPFVETISGELEKALGVRITLNAQTMTVSADFAGQVIIILNELVMNSVKHSKSQNGRITVSLDFSRIGSQDPCGLRMVFRDDGPGLPEGFDPNQTNGFGSRIVAMTVKSLGGSIGILPGKGAGFQIDFPGPLS